MDFDEFDYIKSQEDIDFDNGFTIIQKCSQYYDTDPVKGRRLLINILAHKRKFNFHLNEIISDLLDLYGFYPYLRKEDEDFKLHNISAELRFGIHHSKNIQNICFHEEQLSVLSKLMEQKNIVLSAPTSYGKSLLIEEIIASNIYKNIIIIQPTLALLDETRKKILKYKRDYKILIRTSQIPDEMKGNIFLFTAERVNEYQYFKSIDFLVIDEFYKISGFRDDERSFSLNVAFYQIIKKYNPAFYFLGPNIKKISSEFEQKYNVEFIESSYTLVDANVVDFYKDYKNDFGKRGEKKLFKEYALFDLLSNLNNEQTIIYCSSPGRVRYISNEYCKYRIEEQRQDQIDVPIIDWIKQNVNEKWSLNTCLEQSIGIHDGALQKHISSAIIDYFNRGNLKYLFCTSTIIEGVNTSAKNIVYFDDMKGPNPIDFFDYSNIKGRAGRMMEHYIGTIYNFNPPPERKETVIDIPFCDQNPIEDEVLIHLDDDEIKDKTTKQYTVINSIDPNFKLIAKRNGINIQGQMNLYKYLNEHYQEFHNKLNWNAFPTYEQLKFVLGLAWDYLISSKEHVRPMTKGQLITLTHKYGREKNVRTLIQSRYDYQRKQIYNESKDDIDLINESIQFVFNVIKKWFKYKVPKWLCVIHEIQKYILSDKSLPHGNYLHYANLLENEFLNSNTSILSEFSIPSSAIRKMEPLIPDTINEDNILNFIAENEIHLKAGLIDYEINRIKENL